jgi:hypothetical protein
LNEPACCSNSNFSVSGVAANPKSAPSGSMIGVRRMCGAMIA